MDDPYVRELGRVDTDDGVISIGVDYDSVAVYIGGWLSADGVRLASSQLDEFAQLFVSACWQAGQQRHAITSSGPDGRTGGRGRPVPAGASALARGDQLAAGAPGPAPAASAGLEALARDMLSRFIKTSDGYRARVGQVQIARWAEQLAGEGEGDA